MLPFVSFSVFWLDLIFHDGKGPTISDWVLTFFQKKSVFYKFVYNRVIAFVIEKNQLEGD